MLQVLLPTLSIDVQCDRQGRVVFNLRYFFSSWRIIGSAGSEVDFTTGGESALPDLEPQLDWQLRKQGEAI
jgi:hypothetical protein